MATGILFMVAEKLPALLQSEVLNLSTAKKAIKLMETDLRMVYELLEDDPGLEMNHKELRKWVTNLTDEAQKIEDFVDNFFRNLERRRQRMGCVGSAFLTLKDCVVRCTVVRDIERLKKSIHAICGTKPEKQVLGFVEMVKQLVEGNDPHHLYVCIVGPCGAGKTTCALEVYNTAAGDKNIFCRVWLHANTTLVSSTPYPTVLLNELLRKIRKVTGYPQEELFWMDEMAVCEKIFNTLKDKKYLIVLDINFTHSWSSAMNLMKKAFPDDNNGSRIVLTCTLDIDAHWLWSGVEVHELGFPSPGNRRNLFLSTFDHEADVEATASSSSSSTIPSGLEMTVTEYGLLPSETVNLGAMLSMKCKRGCEINVTDHLYPRTISEIASNYNILEHPLKLCFLYCSLFPQGFGILKRKLILLWLAEGWIPQGDENTAEGYLNKLGSRDMIQVQERDRFSRVKKFRVDSPVWDFAAMKAMQCNLCQNIDNEISLDISNARRLSLNSIGIYNHILEHKKTSVSNVRSLLCFPQLTEIEGDVTFPMPPKFKMIRVLDLEDMYFITQLAEEIGELVHLRYLGLRRTGLYSLPNSIGNLRNLQSLDIRGTRVKPIPTAIQKLERLEFLYMDMDDGSTDDNDSLDLSSLERLRVLSMIRVGRWMVNGHGKLDNLTKLGIYGDPLDYKCTQELTREAFVRFQFRFRFIRMGFGFGDIIPEEMLPRRILSLHLQRPLRMLPVPDFFIEPPRKLCLKWSLLEQDPMVTLEYWSSLEVLKLRCGSFLGKKMVCSACGFPLLIFLELSLLDGLEEWIVDEGAMPNLKHLVIHLCNRLKELPQGLLHLRFIEKLEVAGMPYTFNARLQHNKGEDWHKIEHIKSVTVDGIQMAASSSSSSYSSSSFQPY